MLNIKHLSFRNLLRIGLAIILPISLLCAAFEKYPTSTTNLAIGSMKMSIKGNVLDIISDPSSLIAFNISGGEAIWSRPFEIKELQQTTFATGVVYNNWGFGISANSFGNKIYKEGFLAFSIAKAFKNRMSFGVNILLYQLQIDNFGTAQAPGLSASMRYNITPDWNWITTVQNLNAPKIGESKEALPQIVTSGFVGKLHDIVTVATEWEQDLEYDGALKFGIMVEPLNNLTLMTGFKSNPGQITAGFAINFNKIYFEYGTIAYNDLGLFTHQLGIGVSLDRR